MMREVEFRTIDRMFVKMSVNDKFWVLFALIATVVTAIAGLQYRQTVGQLEQHQLVLTETRLAVMVDIVQATGLDADAQRSILQQQGVNFTSRGAGKDAVAVTPLGTQVCRRAVHRLLTLAKISLAALFLFPSHPSTNCSAVLLDGNLLGWCTLGNAPGD